MLVPGALQTLHDRNICMAKYQVSDIKSRGGRVRSRAKAARSRACCEGRMHAPLILHRVARLFTLCLSCAGHGTESISQVMCRACSLARLLSISSVRTLSKPVLLLGETPCPLYQHVTASVSMCLLAQTCYDCSHYSMHSYISSDTALFTSCCTSALHLTRRTRNSCHLALS